VYRTVMMSHPRKQCICTHCHDNLKYAEFLFMYFYLFLFFIFCFASRILPAGGVRFDLPFTLAYEQR
jgi:hypothetical protein